MSDPPGTARTADGAAATDRGILWLLRGLVTLVLLAALATGVVLLAPGLVDDLVDVRPPIETERPPSPGDRNPDVRHPDDPRNSTYVGDRATIESADVEAFVHHEVNDVRAEHGLEPLAWDGTIASVARAHSADLHEREYFAHVNPDGEDPMDRFHVAGDYCRGYGENIAVTWADRDVRSADGDRVGPYETAAAVADGLVTQWMNSPAHREAILSADWERGGVGVYLDDDGQVFATHNFCATW